MRRAPTANARSKRVRSSCGSSADGVEVAAGATATAVVHPVRRGSDRPPRDGRAHLRCDPHRRAEWYRADRWSPVVVVRQHSTASTSGRSARWIRRAGSTSPSRRRVRRSPRYVLCSSSLEGSEQLLRERAASQSGSARPTTPVADEEPVDLGRHERVPRSSASAAETGLEACGAGGRARSAVAPVALRGSRRGARRPPDRTGRTHEHACTSLVRWLIAVVTRRARRGARAGRVVEQRRDLGSCRHRDGCVVARDRLVEQRLEDAELRGEEPVQVAGGTSACSLIASTVVAAYPRSRKSVRAASTTARRARRVRACSATK